MPPQSANRERVLALLREMATAADPPTLVVIERAQQCIAALEEDADLPSNVAPLDDGAIQLEWDFRGVEVEMEIHDDVIELLVVAPHKGMVEFDDMLSLSIPTTPRPAAQGGTGNQLMNIEQRQGRNRCEFWLDDERIGQVYPTFHPTLRYEAFVLGQNLPSKRVNSIKEAEDWVCAQWADHQFDIWWKNTGRLIDPDTSDVPWFDKRKSLAQSAYVAALTTPRGQPRKAAAEQDKETPDANGLSRHGQPQTSRRSASLSATGGR